jgi:hypothetical protein
MRRGVRVTASPDATSAPMASTSRVTKAMHEAMLFAIASIEALDAQPHRLNGWGPPAQDHLPAGYAVRAPRSSRAARAVFSAVIPSFSRTSGPGALAPKRSIATTRSTQRSHP